LPQAPTRAVQWEWQEVDSAAVVPWRRRRCPAVPDPELPADRPPHPWPLHPQAPQGWWDPILLRQDGAGGDVGERRLDVRQVRDLAADANHRLRTDGPARSAGSASEPAHRAPVPLRPPPSSSAVFSYDLSSRRQDAHHRKSPGAGKFLEAATGVEPLMEVLQSSDGHARVWARVREGAARPKVLASGHDLTRETVLSSVWASRQQRVGRGAAQKRHAAW